MTDTAPADVAAPSSGRTTLQLLRSLGSGPRGLTEAEAERRLARHGENVLPGTRPLSWPLLAARSLRDPFTVVLLCLGLVSATVAAWGTACVILVLVAVSCCLRSAGERRADSAMAGLRELVATTATVLRRPGADAAASPAERELPVSQLVPGDVVRLGPGDLIPADVRLLRAQGLTVQQAAFTGESVPADKRPVDLPADGESAHLCFQGGSVASGSASAVVLATGAGTRFAAAHPTVGSERGASAFDRSVHGISWTLIRFMLLTPPLVLMAGAALRGRGLETLPFAVAVAVGLTPEMLPVIVTTALARGSALLARTHGVIVKRLPALHDIGAVDILCVDKTGTLTQDRPAVDPARTDPDALHWAAVSAWWTLQLADLPTADALDEAVITHALAKDPAVTEAYDGITALPFDPVRRLATAVVRRPGALGTVTLAVKGSVENVLERCALDDAERASLLARAAEMSGDGLRLLAVATAERPARHRPGILPSPSGGGGSTADERGLTFTGFVAFTDALVPTAAQALRDLGERGVTVKVITGDHPGTAARALRDLGLAPGDIHTADTLDALTDEELARLARRTTVFARCAPAHKARIVTALRAGGETTVGFLGDGVNDLPALRAADVGICPRDAVAAARDAADIVLAQPADRPGKDLTAIGHAITAGRHSSGNIATYLRVTLSSNLGNVIAMLSAGLLLPFLPMLPAQVLAQNLCFDAAQLSFAFDRPAAASLRRPTTLRPRDFLRFITGFGVLNAAADLATFGVLALALRSTAGPADEAAFHSGWFTENLLTQALVMLLLRTGRAPRTPGPVRWAVASLAVVGVVLPLTPAAHPLGMTPLPPVYYALLAAVLALYAVALTAVKRRYVRQA
ncbi:magnesium-translocating P-type ATPase [Streptomyces sp. NBC_01474]|uniref:magnesium-translocating P-type ATPase n=1 Tax=unclassified Streptomyces TaxID=2593676 RepID=UPI002DD7C138|nr:MULTISPECIES: magnesium-translocating P-type ATPase [unclassified Streptomyces]WSD97411.1 magnesium-translocating P-type ATPase [Streptomyces sp. NBC_01474]